MRKFQDSAPRKFQDLANNVLVSVVDKY